MGVYEFYNAKHPYYPGIIPSADSVINTDNSSLVLPSWRREIHIHAELVMMIAVKEDQSIPSVSGYTVGFGVWDDVFLRNLKKDVPRDKILARHYAYSIDGSRRQLPDFYHPEDIGPIKDIELHLSVTGMGSKAFFQKNLLYYGDNLLQEAGKLISFYDGDLLCLGPSDEPLVIKADERIPRGSRIRVGNSIFPELTVPVEDKRDIYFKRVWEGCRVDFTERYGHLR